MFEFRPNTNNNNVIITRDRMSLYIYCIYIPDLNPRVFFIKNNAR